MTCSYRNGDAAEIMMTEYLTDQNNKHSIMLKVVGTFQLLRKFTRSIGEAFVSTIKCIS